MFENMFVNSYFIKRKSSRVNIKTDLIMKGLKASYNLPILKYINTAINRVQECTGKLFIYVLKFLKK